MTTTRMAQLLSAAAAVLLLVPQAASQDAAFAKRGASQHTQKRDSARCWRLAQSARLSEEQATQNVLTAYLVGGVIGVLIASSANEEANKDPKSAFRRQAHDECMTKLGYRKVE